MTRRPRLTLSEYSRHLPSGVTLKYSVTIRTFALKKDGYDLATRREETVRQWKRPAEVFGYIARRTLQIQAKPEEKEDERAKEK